MFYSLKEVRKEKTPKELRDLHQKCQKTVDELKSKEAEVIRALQDVDKYKVYRYLGKKSLFQYALSLGLSEAQAYAYISVARKSYECPALQKAIENKELTVSKAKNITSVMNEKNQTRWVEMAKTLPKRELEKKVAQINPRAIKPESVKFINDHLLEMNLPVDEKTYKLIERARDLLCQKKQKHLSLEETLKLMAESFIEKHDPLKKAERAQNRKLKKQCEDVSAKDKNENENKVKNKSLTQAKKSISRHDTKLFPGKVNLNSRSLEKSKRNRLPAKLVHQIYLRDRGKCQFKDPKKNQNTICGESRYVEFHHIQPVALGGRDELENLLTLCSSHHKLIHFKE